MTRHKWASVRWPFDIRALADRLRKAPYTGPSSSGFILDAVRNDNIYGRYVNRMEVSSSITDPYGLKTNYDRIEFDITQFIFRSGLCSAEFIDPPRSIGPLISSLSKLCDDRIAISKISVDPLVWAETILSSSSILGAINSIQLSKIWLDSSTQAKFVVSGKNNVVPAALDLIGDRSRVIEKVKMGFNEKKFGSVVLGCSATATINVFEARDLLACIRISLEELGKNSS